MSPATASRVFDPVTPATDRVEALLALAAVRSAKNGGPAEEWLPFATRRLGPAFRAADMGHTVTWDPPAGLTSIGIRWTCTRCGKAVLAVGSDIEHAYGSALTDPCTASEVI